MQTYKCNRGCCTYKKLYKIPRHRGTCLDFYYDGKTYDGWGDFIENAGSRVNNASSADRRYQARQCMKATGAQIRHWNGGKGMSWSGPTTRYPQPLETAFISRFITAKW